MTSASFTGNMTQTVNNNQSNQTQKDTEEKLSHNTKNSSDVDIKTQTTLLNNTYSTGIIDEDINKTLHSINSAEGQANNANVLLKYFSKNNEKPSKNQSYKSTGSLKNGLKRKKRSINPENSLGASKAPLIVNFETLHPSPETLIRDREIWLPDLNKANLIKSSDLADFNIETLHENNNEHSSKNVKEPPNNPKTNLYSSESSKESSEKEPLNNENTNKEYEESQENENSENDSDPTKNSDDYKSVPAENFTKENTSNEDKPNLSSERDSKESSENSQEYEKSEYTKPDNAVEKSVENYSDEAKKNAISVDTESKSEEDSNSKYTPREKYPYKTSYDSSPEKIIDVDLGDHERIEINKNGQIETAKDTYENRGEDPAVEIITTFKPRGFEKKQSDIISSIPKESTSSSSLESVEHVEPTHINDGEVKPVVEINTEADSTETSEENSAELKQKLENASLETLTGANEKDSSEKYDKLQEDPKNQGNVKQQFERIPLNYNHADAKLNNAVTENNKSHRPDNNENSEDEGEDEGTLDKLKPRYDDKLNIKFDDIHIKLPEIKLPDDILSYNYKEPPIYFKNKEAQLEKPTSYQKPTFYQENKKDKEEKPRFYHYSDEVQDESVEQNEDNEDNGDFNNNKNNYDYYGGSKKNEAYKQTEKNEDEEDDLYEKFVRERFGKRGSFQKRLEKLTDARDYNPYLKEKVKTILQKTEDVKKQAAKSGDPNAGYMWTLEYGEKL